MRQKKHPPYCPPMQHDFEAHQETQNSGYWYISQSKTLLYCKKCGLHFYVDKTPADYPATNSISWTDTGTTRLQFPGVTGTATITYGGDNHCQ